MSNYAGFYTFYYMKWFLEEKKLYMSMCEHSNQLNLKDNG